VELVVDWVKNKGTDIDFRATLTNRTDSTLEIEPQNIRCIRNGENGSVRHQFNGGGLIRLYPNQTRSEVVFCRFSKEGEGPFQFRFEKVYGAKDDESGKVVAKDLGWDLTPQ
jgi:hypothetical protein